jgi:AcrR family transcriptional regulator
VLAEQGYARTTVRDVARTAAVSKGDFYRQFANLSECILESHEVAAQALLAVAEDACASAPEDAFSAAVSAILVWLVEESELGLILTDPALLDVPGLAKRRHRLTLALGHCLASARGGRGWSGSSAENLDLHLVHGARSWTADRLRAGWEGDVNARARELAGLLESTIRV